MANNSVTREAVLKEFRTILGVGKRISEDLWNLGFRSLSQLRGRNPDRMYLDHCKQVGAPVDRCVLYVFRCAVYFASTKHHNAELLKWWNWKDKPQSR